MSGNRDRTKKTTTINPEGERERMGQGGGERAIANGNVTTVVSALATPWGRHPRRGFPDGEPLPPFPHCDGECFTDTELAAARQLVLLSESSSEDVALQAASRSSSAGSSSSVPSVSNKPRQPPRATADVVTEDDEDEEEGISAAQGIRRKRYRSICGLYEVTSPIERGGRKNRS